MTRFQTRGILVAAAAALAIAPQASKAGIITESHFEVNIPPGSTGAASGPIAADYGTGSASALHASAATVYSSPVGNGSAHSYSSNTWAVGDYYQFQTSTTGQSDIYVSWDQTSSGTGPRDFQLQTSTNGTTFTNLGAPYVVLANATPNIWTSGTYLPVSTYVVSAPVLDNQATAYFRLVDNSTVSANAGTVAAGGTDRVDNVVFSAGTPPPVPEPASMGLLAGAALLGLRRRRSR